MGEQSQTSAAIGHQLQIPQLLVSRLGELAKRVERIELEQQQAVDDDSEERAVERENEESLDAIKWAALSEIDDINDALARVRTGTYGRCVSCGGQIDLRRLRAMPAAAKCMTCANAGR